jgi:exosome complex RNA-binding protein Rrp42 (RNase PH superfamily)
MQLVSDDRDYGWDLISFRVIARISIDVTVPPPERKFDGVFQIITEFSPMASPAFEIGRYVLSRGQYFCEVRLI